MTPRRPSRLAIFARHILPLADRLLAVVNRSLAQPTSQSTVGITVAITATRQLWASLGMFVRQGPPLDWSELSAGGFGRRLVKELTETPALRATVLAALRRLAIAAVGDGE